MPKSNSSASQGPSSSHLSEFRSATRKAGCPYVYRTVFGARTESHRLEITREGHYSSKGITSLFNSQGQNIPEMYGFTE